jgi:hypothetical protein
VLVDDTQWLDGSSAASLLFAVRRLVADPVAVVLAIREGESSLIDAADLPTLRLPGLDRGAATELLRQRLSEPLSPELAEQLHRQTGGNPLALVELGGQRRVFDDLALGGPLAIATRVAGVYTQSSRALPARTRDLLALAAASESGEMSLLGRAAASLGWDLAEFVPAENAVLITISMDVSSSATHWLAPPSTPTPRRTSAAPFTVRWPACYPTRMRTAAPGTSRWHHSDRTMRRHRRSNRPDAAPTSGAPTTLPRTPSSAPRSSRPASHGRLVCCTQRPTRRGWAG